MIESDLFDWAKQIRLLRLCFDCRCRWCIRWGWLRGRWWGGVRGRFWPLWERKGVLLCSFSFMLQNFDSKNTKYPLKTRFLGIISEADKPEISVWFKNSSKSLDLIPAWSAQPFGTTVLTMTPFLLLVIEKPNESFSLSLKRLTWNWEIGEFWFWYFWRNFFKKSKGLHENVEFLLTKRIWVFKFLTLICTILYWKLFQ